jgi:hypothetical protein
MHKTLLVVATIAAMAHLAEAAPADAVLRESGAVELAAPHSGVDAAVPHKTRHLATDSVTAFDNASPLKPLAIYPVAGTFGKDLYIPYFVDLDPLSGAKRDFACGEFTFDGHDGDDPYIRSFREQDIGVPIFAPGDGTITTVHDGEPDHNTDNNPAAKPNFVVLQLNDGTQLLFNHVRKGSIAFRERDRVSAGAQLALVGSSGASTAPHAHIGMSNSGAVIEPFAGPCRAGSSYFAQQPAVTRGPTIIGTAFSNTSYANFPAAPIDNAPRTGTFLRGFQRIYFKMEIANLPPDAPFRVSVVPPNTSSISNWVEGKLSTVTETSRLGSFWWGVDADLYTVGEWTLLFDVNGTRILSTPFRVVASASEIVNHRPNDISVAIEPATITANDIPVCRVTTAAIADPDYDVVAYKYEWEVDGRLVRSVTSAARSDALATNLIRRGAPLRCSVTPTDGSLLGTTATAFASSQATGRRHVAR